MTSKRVRKVVQAPDEAKPAPPMQIVMMRLSWLTAHQAPRNPKRHDVEGVGASMERFGYTIPIALDETTQSVVAGHGRIETLNALKNAGEPPPRRVIVTDDGDWLVPVLRGLDFADPDEAEAYLIADNRHTEIGGYDNTLLAEMLEDLRDRKHSFDGLGWSAEAATDMIASIRNATAGADSEPRERTPPEDFQDHDANSKTTVHCPRCGYPVPTDG